MSYVLNAGRNFANNIKIGNNLNTNNNLINNNTESSPRFKNYELDKEFLSLCRILLIISLVLTLLILLIFLLIRPGHLLGDLHPDVINDHNFDYMIYTHIGSYLMAVFSLSLMLFLLDHDKISPEMIIYPTFMLSVKVAALVGYYFYYTNSYKKGYNFKKDYLGYIYIIFSIILFSLYITVFVKSIQEKKRLRLYNAGVGAYNNQIIYPKKEIEQSHQEHFDDNGIRVGDVTKNWLNNYIEKNLKAGLSVEKVKEKINEQMDNVLAIYKHGNNFFDKIPAIKENIKDKLFPMYINSLNSKGENMSTEPSPTLPLDLKINDYLNPKVLVFAQNLAERYGINTSKIMDYFPSVVNGDFREKMAMYTKQMSRGRVN